MTISNHYQRRQSVANFTSTQVTVPLRLYTPRSLNDLKKIVTEASANGYRVRAAGSLHSWSDVAMSQDFMVDTTSLNHVLDRDTDVLYESSTPSTLFRSECGITL